MEQWLICLPWALQDEASAFFLFALPLQGVKLHTTHLKFATFTCASLWIFYASWVTATNLQQLCLCFPFVEKINAPNAQLLLFPTFWCLRLGIVGLNKLHHWTKDIVFYEYSVNSEKWVIIFFPS